MTTEESLRKEFELLEKQRQFHRDELNRVVNRQIQIWEYCCKHPEVFACNESQESKTSQVHSDKEITLSNRELDNKEE